MPSKLLRTKKLLGRKPDYIKKRACIVSKSQFDYTTSFDIYTTLNVPLFSCYGKFPPEILFFHACSANTCDDATDYYNLPASAPAELGHEQKGPCIPPVFSPSKNLQQI